MKSILNATRANYRNIKRICDTTQDPSYCYMAEAILPHLESMLEEFEQGINIAKPLKIYKIDENSNVGEVLLEITDRMITEYCFVKICEALYS